MTFARPEVLLLLVLVPSAMALFVRAARKRKEALALFSGNGTGATAGRFTHGTVRAVIQTTALALVIVALAGPRAGTALTEARRAGLDLVVALDVSASMTAEDIPPSRLERARFIISRLAETRTSDRLALVVFAGEAALLSPLTRDAAAFRLYLDAAGPDVVGSAGSEPARALGVAGAAFDDLAGSARPRAVLLVSDGENPNVEGDDTDASAMADELRRAGVEVLALGVGSPEGGTIPLPGGREKRDRDGDVVVTRLDPPALARIAGDDVFDIAADPLRDIDGRLDEIAGAGASIERVPAAAERYQWPLAIALLLLVCDRFVANAARRPPRVGTPAERLGVQSSMESAPA